MYISKKKKKIIGSIIIMLLLLPIIGLQLKNILALGKFASDEGKNKAPIIVQLPEDTFVAGEIYKSKLVALDPEEDKVAFSFTCPYMLETSGTNIVHEECKDIKVVKPDKMSVDASTGEIVWDTNGITDEQKAVVYVNDGVDYTKVELIFTPSHDVANAVKSLQIYPSSGIVPVGEKIKMRAVIQSDDGIKKITAVVLNSSGEEVQKYEWQFESPVTDTILLDENSNLPFVFVIPADDSYSVTIKVETEKDVSLYKKVLSLIIPKAYAQTEATIQAGDNTAPLFESVPNCVSIDTGVNYSTRLVASDAEGDSINYTVVVFPEQPDWLNVSVNAESNGHLEINFSGIPDRAQSYMATVTINDGLENHYVTAVWTIDVKQPSENDTPQITIVQPSNAVNINNNESVRIQWDIYDRNPIDHYDIYYTMDPTNQDSWVHLQRLDYNYNAYIWVPGNIDSGRYYIVVTATDSTEHPLTGSAVSQPINVTNTDVHNESNSDEGTNIVNNGSDDDSSEESEGSENTAGSTYALPEILNIYPMNSQEVSQDITISADLNAGDGNKILEDSIRILVDGKDVTEKSTFNRSSDQKMSFAYVAKDLKEGKHVVSVSFSNDKENEAKKEWYFSVEISTQNAVTTSESDELVISVFGYDIPVAWVLIGGGVIIAIILLLLTLWLLSALFGGGKPSSTDLENYSTSDLDIKYETEPQKPATVSEPSDFYQNNAQNVDQTNVLNNNIEHPSEPNTEAVATENNNVSLHNGSGNGTNIPNENSNYNDKMSSSTNENNESVADTTVNASNAGGKIAGNETPPVESNDSLVSPPPTSPVPDIGTSNGGRTPDITI